MISLESHEDQHIRNIRRACTKPHPKYYKTTTTKNQPTKQRMERKEVNREKKSYELKKHKTQFPLNKIY